MNATISKNVERFVSNLTLMNQDLTDRSKNIMKTIEKINRVGSLNKYMSSGNYITLQPRSRNLPIENREQVLLTHSRKKSEGESIRKFQKFYLPKMIELVKSVIVLTS